MKTDIKPHASPLQSLARRGLLVACIAGLSACGFQLRQPPNFAFKTIYTAVAPNSLMGIELKRNLSAVGGVTLLTDPLERKNADVVLDILSEAREKVVVGVNSSGQVREFQLRLKFRFRLRTPEGKDLIPDTEIVQQRDISFNESAALSKEVEEAQLYRAMQSDVVQQLLRRLAAVKAF
jgi:LPS-assembly lipoprotein